MSNHTSGPWFVYDSYPESKTDGDVRVFVPHDGTERINLCTLHWHKNIHHKDGFMCNAKANAKLIAAAPELLEMIKVYLNAMLSWRATIVLMSHDINPRVNPGMYDENIAKLKSLIAKAQGEPQ